MKIKGQQVSPPKPVEFVIYREDAEGNPANITFLCGAVLDYSEFEKLCPVPKAPLRTDIKTGEQTRDTNHKRFRIDNDLYADRRINYMIIKSISATPDLEWDTVKLDDPETWKNYESELRTFLTPAETTLLVNAAIEANSPSKNRRKEALENFTALGDQVQLEIGSQVEEPTTTPSGDAVNA